MSPDLLRPATAAALAAAVVGSAVLAHADAPAPRPRLELLAAAPVFTADDLVPGTSRVACLGVANRGDAPGRVALYAPVVDGPLARHLDLTVAGGCAAGGGELFSGRLDELPSTLAAALLDPRVLAAGADAAYRFELAVRDDAAAEGLAAHWTWRLAAESLAVGHAAPAEGSPPPAVRTGRAASTGCERVQLAGTQRGIAHRTLVRTVRVSSRVGAVLVVRVLGAAGAERLVLTSGLRVRGGRTLRTPGWARVAYAVNGGAAVRAGRRPFRVRVPAGAVRPGANRIAVRVRPRRGRSRTTVFGLRATTTVLGGRRVCVLGA